MELYADTTLCGSNQYYSESYVQTVLKTQLKPVIFTCPLDTYVYQGRTQWQNLKSCTMYEYIVVFSSDVFTGTKI